MPETKSTCSCYETLGRGIRDAMWQLEQTPCHKKIAVVSYSTFSTVPFLRAGSRLWKGMVGSHPPFHRKIFRSISTNNDRRYSCACHPIPTNKKIFRLPCNNKRWSSLSPLLPWLNSSIPSIRLRSWVPNLKCEDPSFAAAAPAHVDAVWNKDGVVTNPAFSTLQARGLLLAKEDTTAAIPNVLSYCPLVFSTCYSLILMMIAAEKDMQFESYECSISTKTDLSCYSTGNGKMPWGDGGGVSMNVFVKGPQADEDIQKLPRMPMSCARRLAFWRIPFLLLSR